LRFPYVSACFVDVTDPRFYAWTSGGRYRFTDMNLRDTVDKCERAIELWFDDDFASAIDVTDLHAALRLGGPRCETFAKAITAT